MYVSSWVHKYILTTQNITRASIKTTAPTVPIRGNGQSGIFSPVGVDPGVKEGDGDTVGRGTSMMMIAATWNYWT